MAQTVNEAGYSTHLLSYLSLGPYLLYFIFYWQNTVLCFQFTFSKNRKDMFLHDRHIYHSGRFANEKLETSKMYDKR